MDDVCLEDGCVGGGEDIVDFWALGGSANLEAAGGGDVLGVGMEGAEGVEKGQWGEVALGISGEIGLAFEELYDYVVFGGVEVAGEDKGIGVFAGEDTLGDEGGALDAGRLGTMIEMGVEDVEGVGGVFVDESGPGADAGDGVAPVFGGGYFGGVGEPKSAGIEEGEAVAAVEDGGVFSGGIAVVASDADFGEFGEGGADLIELEAEGFLEADDVGGMVLEDIENHVAAIIPVVLAVVGGAVADVEGHDVEFEVVGDKLIDRVEVSRGAGELKT